MCKSRVSRLLPCSRPHYIPRREAQLHYSRAAVHDAGRAEGREAQEEQACEEAVEVRERRNRAHEASRDAVLGEGEVAQRCEGGDAGSEWGRQ